jgi:hypothetical protein
VFNLIIYALNLYKKHHGNAMQFWKRIFEIYHANESLLEKHVEFFGTSAFVGSPPLSGV